MHFRRKIRLRPLFYAAAWLPLLTAALPCPKSSAQSPVVRKVPSATTAASLRRFSETWQEHTNKKDAAALAALYTQDTRWLAPNAPPISGRDAVLKSYTQLFGLPEFRLRHTTRERLTDEPGNIAVETGTYDISFRKPDNGQFRDQGKYLFVLTRDTANAPWRITMDMFSSDQAAPTAATQPPPTPPAGTVTVQVYHQQGMGSVNSFWFDTADGLVLIDCQRTEGAGAGLVAALKATGRPLAAIILTHVHPDHIGGLVAVHTAFPGVPIYASADTQSNLREDRQGYLKNAKKFLGAAFPDRARFPIPDRVLGDGERLTIGGTVIEGHVLGVGEAENMLLLYLPEQKKLFAADAVASKMTPYLAEGHIGAWIKQLDVLQTRYGNADTAITLYPGHGDSGGAATLIADQKSYLVTFRDAVAASLAGGKTLSANAKTKIVEMMQKKYPDYLFVSPQPTAVAIPANADAVAAELSAPSGKQ